MSEDRKKALRTQGRFSDELKKKKSQENVKKTSLKESDAKSAKHQSMSRTYVDILKEEKTVEYTENNTSYSFNELSSKKEPVEIKNAGEQILSESANGESRIVYVPDFMEEQEALSLFHVLQKEIPWDRRNIIIRGQEYPQPRLVTWYGPYPYTYSGLTLEPAEMPESVVNIKRLVEQYLASLGLDVTLNSVLLNLYRDGHDSIAWHSDDELSMGVKPTIASVSLGAVRRFLIRKKLDPHEIADADKKEADFCIQLTNGSLFVMDGCMQKDWQHSVPKQYHDKDPRINLTFRTVYALDQEVSKMDYQITGSNKRLAMKETENIEVPLMKAANHSTTDLSKLDEEFPPLDDNKWNTKTYKQAVVPDTVIKTQPEKSKSLEIKQNVQDITLGSDPIRKTSSASFNNRKRSLAEKSDSDGTSENSRDKSTYADSVVKTASNAEFNDTNCALVEKSDSNETKQDSQDKYEYAFSAIETASNASLNDTNHSLAKKSESSEIKQDIPDKSIYADSVRDTASNASFNERNHNVNDKYVDKGIEPSQEKLCPPFSNPINVVVGTTLNVHAKPFEPIGYKPPFPTKPNISEEKPEEKIVVPDNEQCSYTGSRQHSMPKDLWDWLELPLKELVPLTEFFVEEILRSIKRSFFCDRDREELQFLCDISDGCQTQRNQSLICNRIQILVRNALPDSRSKMMRSSQNRQAKPSILRSNMSPRHHNQLKYDKRNDSMYKRQ